MDTESTIIGKVFLLPDDRLVSSYHILYCCMHAARWIGLDSNMSFELEIEMTYNRSKKRNASQRIKEEIYGSSIIYLKKQRNLKR